MPEMVFASPPYCSGVKAEEPQVVTRTASVLAQEAIRGLVRMRALAEVDLSCDEPMPLSRTT